MLVGVEGMKRTFLPPSCRPRQRQQSSTEDTFRVEEKLQGCTLEGRPSS